MNFVKKNYRLIIGIIIGAILISGISVYATGQYLASQVEYNKNGQAKVSDALDDLYSKVPSGTKTITEKGNQIDVSKYQYADTTGLYTQAEATTGEGRYWIKDSFKCGDGFEYSYPTNFQPSMMILKAPDNSGNEIWFWSVDCLNTIYARETGGDFWNDNAKVFFNTTNTGISSKGSWNSYSGQTFEIWLMK